MVEELVQSPDAPGDAGVGEVAFDERDEILDEADESNSAASDCEVAPSSLVLNQHSRGRGKSWRVSLLLALVIHGVAIGLGLYFFVKPADRFAEPRLILPQGWATEFEGSGNAGAGPLFQNLQAMTVTPPVLSAVAEQPLDDPPNPFESPEITPPRVVIDASHGTTELEPLPSLGGIARAPINRRTPPVSSEPVGASGASASEPSDTADHTNGSAPAGAGGGTQGVPEGMPVPSIHNKIPPYPAEALRKGWTGTVRLELTIAATGQVSDARVISSSGYPILDQSALETARTWEFTPAILNGKPIAWTVPRNVNFDQPTRNRR